MRCVPFHLCCAATQESQTLDTSGSDTKQERERFTDIRPRSVQQRARQAKLSTRLNHGRLFLKGLFASGGSATTNGRVYPQAVLSRERRRYQQCLMKAGKGFGELLHPSYHCESFNKLHLNFVSHQVVSLWEVGRQLVGVVEVLDTPAGRLVRDWYLRGGRLGASLRGSCSTTELPHTELVGSDFELSTFDLVILPASSAMLEPIMEVMALPQPDYAARMLWLAASSWPGVVPLHPVINEALLQEIELTVEQRHLLSTWFQTQLSASEQAALRAQLSQNKRSLARILTLSGSEGELPDFSRTSLQKKTLRGSRVSSSPSRKWKPGPVISSAADLCTRAQLLQEYVRELQCRPALVQ